MKRLLILVSVWLGFFNFISEAQAAPNSLADRNKLKDFTYHYSLSRRAIETLLGHESTKDADLEIVLDILRDCTVNESSEGTTAVHRIVASDKCDIDFTKKEIIKDLGENENGDPVTETLTTEELKVNSAAMASLLGFKSWSLSEHKRAETLASSPVFEEVSTTTVHFQTDYKEVVSLSLNTRSYENLETDDRPYFRNATIQFKDFSAQFNVKATVRSGVVVNSTAYSDGAEISLQDLLKTYTTEVVGLPDLSN